MPAMPRSMEEYRSATKAQRARLATALAKDRTAGLSGNELREKYSGDPSPKTGFPTGPQRISILREHGLGSVVAKSYKEYRDGDTRTGSPHAREHGPLATVSPVERKKAAKAAAAKAARATRKAAKAAPTA